METIERTESISMTGSCVLYSVFDESLCRAVLAGAAVLPSAPRCFHPGSALCQAATGVTSRLKELIQPSSHPFLTRSHTL